MQQLDSQDINHQVTTILLKRIIELLDVKEEPPQTIQADEVRAALRNELSAVIKSIKAIPEPDNKDILKELKNLQTAIKAIELKPNINVEAAKVNIPDVIVPTISLPDITIPAFEIPTPQVNYTPPEIHIPAPIVNIPAPNVYVEPTDLASVIKALDLNLNKLRTNGETRPLAVRWTDGQNWIKELQKNREQTTQFLSDVSYIKSADGTRINPATEEGLNRIIDALTTSLSGAVTVTSGNITLTSPTFIGDDSQTVTTAGTRVQLSTSTLPIKYVIITAKEANTGTIWIGGSTIAAGRGRPLVALQSERLEIDYLTKVYIDSTVDGEGVTYTYSSNEAISPTGYIVDDSGNLILDDSGNPILGE